MNLEAMQAGKARAAAAKVEDSHKIVADYHKFLTAERLLLLALRDRREQQGVDQKYLELNVKWNKLWRDVTIPTDAQFAAARS